MQSHTIDLYEEYFGGADFGGAEYFAGALPLLTTHVFL